MSLSAAGARECLWPIFALVQSINWQQLEIRGSDDGDCACVLESLVHFGTNTTVDAWQELDLQ